MITKIALKMIILLTLSVSTLFGAHVMTWVPSYFIDESKAMLNADFGGVGMKDGVTHLALQFWGPVGTSGAIGYVANGGSTANNADVDWFKSWGATNNAKVLLCIYNGANGWDWATVNTIISNPSSRTTLVNNLVTAMKDRGLDGVEVDLEGPQVTDGTAGQNFITFMKELSTKVKAEGKIVTVATFSSQWHTPGTQHWSSLFPLVELLTSMGYQETGIGAAGDLSYAGQKNLAGSANASKLALGMPTYYGGSWAGGTVQQSVDWAKNNGTSVAIWDCSLGNGDGAAEPAWRTAAVWNSLKAIKGTGGITTKYTITPSVSGSGTISPAAAVTLNAGSSQAFTFAANAGYQIDSIRVNSVKVAGAGTTSYSITNLNENKTITAYIGAIPTYTITSSVNGSTGGTISPLGSTNVAKGGSQSYVFTANSGYQLDSVKVGTAKVTVANNSYTLSNITANSAIVAYFGAKKSYMVTTAVTGSGTISPAGTVSLFGDESKEFTFTPSNGFRIDSVKLDGAKVTIANNRYTITNITANKTLAVWFGEIPVTYAITATSTGTGSVTPLGTTTVSKGGSQVYSIVANSGSRLDSVKVNGLKVTTLDGSYTFSSVQSNQSIAAWFSVIPSYSVTASSVKVSGGNGSISPTGTKSYAEGTDAVYYFTANTGSRLDSVKVNGIRVTIVGTSYAIEKIRATTTIVAYFGKIPSTTYTITAIESPNGTISPSGSTVVAQNGSQQYTFTPNSGFVLDSVKVDGNKTAIVSNTYTFSNVVANHSVEAFFGAAPSYTVKTSVVGKGTVSPAGTSTVNKGDTLKLTFSATSGYRLDSVKVDGAAVVLTGSSYSLDSIRANHTVVAYFGVNTGIDTTNPSANLISWSTFVPHADELGSVADTGTALIGANGASLFYSLKKSNSATDLWAWADLSAELPVGPKNNLTGVNYIKVTYASTDTMALLLNQSNLSAEGSSYRATLPSTGGSFVTVLLKITDFTQPDWVETATPLALSAVTSVAFLLEGSESVEKYEQLKVKELVLYNYGGLEKAQTYRITATASEGILLTPAGGVDVIYQKNADFQFESLPGYVVDSVLVDGIRVLDSGSYQFAAVMESHTIEIFGSKESGTAILTVKKSVAAPMVLKNPVWSRGSDQLPELIAKLPAKAIGTALTIALYDALGNNLIRFTHRITSETETITIPVNEVFAASGFYLLLIEGSDGNGSSFKEKKMIGIKE